MTTINELIQQLTPFSAQEHVEDTIVVLRALTIAVTSEGVENSAQQLIKLLPHNNAALSNIAFDGIMTMARLKPTASSFFNAAGASVISNRQVLPEAIAKVKSLLNIGLIAYSDAPGALIDLVQFYAKESPNRSSFFGLSVTERAASSLESSHSQGLLQS